jgi:predicted ATPase/DNA-binding SARP family transcriptional activator
MSASAAPGANHALQLYLLGGFRVVVGGRETPECAWGLRRARNLVKLLALSPRYRLHRERVVDLLWPDQELENPDNSLSQALYAARRTLGGATRNSTEPYLQRQGEMVTLAPETAVWVDVEAFEAAAASARRSQDPAAYRAALALYTGPLLPEDQYEEWVNGRAEALKRVYLRLLTGLAATHEASGAYEEAIAPLLRAVELDPTGEGAHVALMRLYTLAGQRPMALQRYEALRRTLRDELGVEPQPASVRLYEDIIAGRYPPDADTRAAASTGEPAHATNLPQRMSRFIGRARELDEIGRLLDGAPIVTLAGPGGSGKTRLALEAAETLAPRYPGGVWLIELAGIERPSAIPQALAAALGVIEQPGRPLMETITAALASDHALLLLDNCEHLIGACAELAETLARACPSLRLLCTSREPLHIPGEIVWRLSSLSLPSSEPETSLEGALASESIQLFVDRARALAPGFTLDERNAPAIIRICRRLDGLPLAIELAAARVGTLAVEHIAERLDDGLGALGRGSRTGPTRQQTLTAALDWSYGLLSERERGLFRRLAVFPSGFDLEAAEWIARWISAGSSDERAADDDTLDALASLVDKSLVVMDESAGAARYRLLEPLRQYAEARLKARGELAVACARRRDWGQALAERADGELWGEEHSAAVGRLEAEYAALRATLEWLLSQQGEARSGARLIAALWQFWLLRGMFTEGRYWLERLLARMSEQSAEALIALFGLTLRQGDYASGAAREAAERSVAIYRALGDGEGTGRALRMLGVQAYMTGDFARAGQTFEESLSLARAAGDVAGQGLALHELGALAWARGAYAEASERMEGALAQLRAAEDYPRAAVALLNLGLAPYDAEPDAPLVNEETWVLLRALSGAALVGYTLAHLGALARAQGDFHRARARLEESVAWLRRCGDQAGLAQALGQMGALARVQGDYRRARALLDDSLALRRQLGDRRGVGMTGANLGLLALAEGDYAEATARFAEVMAQFVEMGDGSGIEMTLDHQAHLALRQGDARRADALYSECLAGHRAMGRGPLDAARALTGLGASAIALGDSAAARAHLQEAIALYERIGDERRFASLRGRLSEMAPPQA